ncbi:response regulator transcription factor [Synechococcus sp. WH 8016]|uniref:response regulator transcription factor n=1 Tax=Synechococcus sp. WH 8016 TaxID=166318 RepID=UPI00022D90F1|nr:two component transcriptional regulator, winged helix family [Synechococcus sp. WH 8016]
MKHSPEQRRIFQKPGMPAMPQEQPNRLLIVDDDPELLRFLLEEFSSETMECIAANCGADALMHLRQSSFDLVLLDWTLPDFEGIEICRRLRSSGDTTPVLMLTARDDLDERVRALDLGVDDYLTKPFELKELHARVRARLRRGQYASAERVKDSLNLGDLHIDLIEHQVHRGDRALSLSQREFELLAHLVKHTGEVQTRQQILESVWGKPFVGDPNSLDVYMGYLRKKVEAQGDPQLLHTVRGVGFMARVGDPKS